MSVWLGCGRGVVFQGWASSVESAAVRGPPKAASSMHVTVGDAQRQNNIRQPLAGAS